MAKSLPPTTLDAILQAVRADSGGASIAQIEAALTAPPGRRTLQRWLAQLQAQGRIRKEGQGSATRYRSGRIVEASAVLEGRADVEAQGEALIALSEAGQHVMDAVRQPRLHRKPVGYDRALLDSYRPNQTYYFPAALRDALRAAGQDATQADQPAGTYARQLFDRLLIDLS